jgi:serine/threonine protein kinase
LAPELLHGKGYTKTVDWWTLGVLLYEMLCGLPPFYDENVNIMYHKILYDPLRFPDDIDPKAKSILTAVSRTIFFADMVVAQSRTRETVRQRWRTGDQISSILRKHRLEETDG